MKMNCQVCHKSFSRIENLRRHEKLVCGRNRLKKFRIKNIHSASERLAKQSLQLNCKFCNKSFSRTDSRCRHERSCRSPNKISYTDSHENSNPNLASNVGYISNNSSTYEDSNSIGSEESHSSLETQHSDSKNKMGKTIIPPLFRFWVLPYKTKDTNIVDEFDKSKSSGLYIARVSNDDFQKIQKNIRKIL